MSGWLALTLFCGRQAGSCDRGLFSNSTRTVLSPSLDPIFRPRGSRQLFACHNSMKDFHRNFKALPSVQHYRALRNANLQHDCGPQKRYETLSAVARARFCSFVFSSYPFQIKALSGKKASQNAECLQCKTQPRCGESTIFKQKRS